MKENSLPDITNLLPQVLKIINSIEFDALNVLNFSNTEKKRHSFSIAQKKNKDSNFKNRPFSSFNMVVLKNKLDSRKPNPQVLKEAEIFTRKSGVKNKENKVGEIVKE